MYKIVLSTIIDETDWSYLEETKDKTLRTSNRKNIKRKEYLNEKN